MKKIPKIAIPTTKNESVINYVAALKHLGADPVVIDKPRNQEDFDGLLLPGGADIDPARYGKENAGSRNINTKLDELQFEVFNSFYNAEKPILGICRGHQLVNVALGGTLIQDIDSSLNPNIPAQQRVCHLKGLYSNEAAHPVNAEPGSFIWDCYGSEFAVNSVHHQAIDKIAEDLIPVLWSADGIIEACAHKNRPIWTVQFHPERMCFEKKRIDTVDGSLVIDMFVETTRR